jgi:hypothetical protein
MMLLMWGNMSAVRHLRRRLRKLPPRLDSNLSRELNGKTACVGEALQIWDN